jgi:hypothetical protein
MSDYLKATKLGWKKPVKNAFSRKKPKTNKLK